MTDIIALITLVGSLIFSPKVEVESYNLNNSKVIDKGYEYIEINKRYKDYNKYVGLKTGEDSGIWVFFNTDRGEVLFVDDR